MSVSFAKWLRDNTVSDGAPKLLFRPDMKRYTIEELYDLYQPPTKTNMNLDLSVIKPRSFIGYCIQQSNDPMIVATAIVEGYIDIPKKFIECLGKYNVLEAHRYYINQKYNFTERIC